MSDISFSKLTWENLPARTTALSATNLNRIENGIDDSVNGVNANSHSIAELQTRISQIANGSPTPVSTVAEMTDESAVYLYMGSETGYTAGNWYYWSGSAWTSGGTYGGAVTDTTLSVSGAPADAKAVGDALAEKADADDLTAIDERVTVVEEYADIFTADVDESVQNWLDEHPEATTTVQDGSLTEAKFSNALKLKTIKDYVTPEIFGAAGDGVTDDTDAFNTACNSNLPVVLTENKTYYVPSRISVNNPLVLFGNQAIIKTDRSTEIRQLFVLYDNAKKVIFNNVHFFTTLGQTITGAHGETIQNRSNKTAIASYGLDALLVENCTFENFDEGIVGQTSSEDTTLQNVLDRLIVSKVTIENTLQGISRHYRHVNIDGCTITLDSNGGTGEHCIYILNEVLEDFFVSNTLLDAKHSPSYSAIQFYPSSSDSISQVRSICHIQNCIISADGYITSKGDTSINLSNCTLKSPSYNTTNRTRAFSIEDADTLTICNSDVQIEFYDHKNELITFRSCNIHSEKLMNERMALFEAFDSIFENIGLTLSNYAKIMNCEFSNPVGKYYLSVSSTVTKSYAINCIFKSDEAVGISYNSDGYCDVISPITTLPTGISTPNINVVNKIEVSL